jgi:cytidylate kinase
MSTESVDILRNYLGAMSQARVRRSVKPRPAITISRETGSGALVVANLVAKQLDLECPGDPPCPWAVFERALVTKILEDHSLSQKIEEFMPEEFRFPLSEAFEFLLGLHPPSWVLREYAKETIRKLATSGNVILVGRGGAVITKRLAHVLHVRLVAPFDFRVRNVARIQGVSERQAVRMVRANDAANRHYVRAYLNANVRDSSYYDLVVNTATAGFDRTARIISAAVLDLVRQGKERSPARNTLG